MGRMCSICRDAFAAMLPDTATVELPACRHAFCEECLGGWWSACSAAASNSCPDCRRVYSGLRRCPRSTAGAMTAAASMAHPANPCVASKRQRHVGLAGNVQAVDQELDSSAEEDCEPVSKRGKVLCATVSEFVGVSLKKRTRKWGARITHDGKKQHLGSFDDEQEAARAVDTAARRLRGQNAHGGRAGTNWLRLNFPSKREVARAKALGMPAARYRLTDEDKAEAVAESEQQGPSKFVGVSWDKSWCKWMARIYHGGKRQHLGYFDDEHEAARAVDTGARQLRGKDAHGGRGGGGKWLRLNFPSKREAGRAKALGMPAAHSTRPTVVL